MSNREMHTYFHKNYTPLLKQALRYTDGDRDLAEDAVQDAMAAVLLYDCARATRNLQGALRTVARRAMTSTIRKWRSGSVIDVSDGLLEAE